PARVAVERVGQRVGETPGPVYPGHPPAQRGVGQVPPHELPGQVGVHPQVLLRAVERAGQGLGAAELRSEVRDDRAGRVPAGDVDVVVGPPDARVEVEEVGPAVARVDLDVEVRETGEAQLAQDQ